MDDESLQEVPVSLQHVYRAFGQYVREHREALGLSGRDMARALELSQAYVSGMERGKYAPPGRDVLVRMAEFLQVPKDELMSRAGKIEPARLRGLWSGGDIRRALIASGLSEENARHLQVAVVAYIDENAADQAGRVP
jgi:transcriptional regulator with XRE-family HTH domain